MPLPSYNVTKYAVIDEEYKTVKHITSKPEHNFKDV